MPKATGLRCSFCGKHQDEVAKLIAGPGVYICSECVDLCGDIIAEGRKETGAPPTPPVADLYQLHLLEKGGAEHRLAYPLPIGTVGVQLRVVTRGGSWCGPCPSCGAWTLQSAERTACFHCGTPLPTAERG